MPEALGQRLIRRWIEFGRLLRRNGVLITAGQMRDLLAVLAAPAWDWTDRQTIYYVARALLCARHEDWPRFDLIFRQYWGRTRQIIIPSDTTAPRPETQTAPRLQRPGKDPPTRNRRPLTIDRCDRHRRARPAGHAARRRAAARTGAALQRLRAVTQPRLRRVQRRRSGAGTRPAGPPGAGSPANGAPGACAPARAGGASMSGRRCAAPCAPAASPSTWPGAARAANRARSCSSATSAARWPPTRACCSISSTPSATACGSRGLRLRHAAHAHHPPVARARRSTRRWPRWGTR